MNWIGLQFCGHTDGQNASFSLFVFLISNFLCIYRKNVFSV